METDIQLYTDMLALSHQKQAENRPEMVQDIPGGQEPAEMVYIRSCDVDKASLINFTDCEAPLNLSNGLARYARKLKKNV